MINQGVGMAMGCIVIFLALFMSFQDNTRDMIILNMMGYEKRDIRRLLLGSYQIII